MYDVSWLDVCWCGCVSMAAHWSTDCLPLALVCVLAVSFLLLIDPFSVTHPLFDMMCSQAHPQINCGPSLDRTKQIPHGRAKAAHGNRVRVVVLPSKLHMHSLAHLPRSRHH